MSTEDSLGRYTAPDSAAAVPVGSRPRVGGGQAMTGHDQVGPIYVASRASIPERSAMWRQFRSDGWQITSTWIDEAGEGETADFTELWDRIAREIATAHKLVFYAQASDFPLKGAILEAGIALGMGKPVIVCLPGVILEGRTKRPVGSWLAHRNVVRCDWLPDAMAYHNFERALAHPLEPATEADLPHHRTTTVSAPAERSSKT